MRDAAAMDWRAAAAAFSKALADTEATPGGGSAAAAVGSMGCALGEMAAGISVAGKKADAGRKRALEDARRKLAALRFGLDSLAAADAAAFEAVMAAYKLPKEEAGRAQRIQEALVRAGEIPLDTARTARKGLALVQGGARLALGTVASDMNCAAHLLRAAALCAIENVAVNVSLLKDPEARGRLAAGMEEVRASL